MHVCPLIVGLYVSVHMYTHTCTYTIQLQSALSHFKDGATAICSNIIGDLRLKLSNGATPHTLAVIPIKKVEESDVCTYHQSLRMCGFMELNQFDSQHIRS